MSVDERSRALARRRRPADPLELPTGGTIEGAAWLGEEVLVLVVSLPGSSTASTEIWLSIDGSWRRAESSTTPLGSGRARGESIRQRHLVVANVERDQAEVGDVGPVAVRSGASDFLLEPLYLEETLTAPEDLLRAELPASSTAARTEVVDLLVRSTAGVVRSRRKLNLALFNVREALRVRLPLSIVDPAEPRAIAVDAIWRLDERAFYLEGWARHEDAELESLTAVSPEGERVELCDNVFRCERPDVSAFYGLDSGHGEQLGFIAYLETRAVSTLADGWVVELRDSLGGAVESSAPPVSTDPSAARLTILGDLALERPPAEALKTTHIRPAIERLQRRLVGPAAIETLDVFGSPPVAPEVSIVVPLYRRVDFVEQQLAQFVHDPELREADLVYVLDSPEQADYLREHATQLFRLYGVPFRLATLTCNGGFSAANNLGASVATGRLLLLLNSDVLPEQPGWLGALTRFYDSTPGIGALAPKLLYEDDSLQHAGLYFDRPAGAFMWANEHYFKGLHRDLPAANVARPVPAVTGACLMIDRSLYKELGGLRGGYVQGDYEDSDLCLRLAAIGRECWYLPEVALYHLEGQSYPSEERTLASQYNRWLHTHLWNDAIEAIAAKEGRRP